MELHLLLVRADAGVVGDRRLLMQGTCQDMAEAVATVIAAWETQPLPRGSEREGALGMSASQPPSRSALPVDSDRSGVGGGNLNCHRPRLAAHRAVTDKDLITWRIHIDVRFQV